MHNNYYYFIFFVITASIEIVIMTNLHCAKESRQMEQPATKWGTTPAFLVQIHQTSTWTLPLCTNGY